jgi:glycolate oxidase iron-sulfur subunit
MQTHFTAEQLADPQVRESDRILRACVHCGFCTATCPTYLLTGDELDGPRGRIYLAKDMLEKNRPADPTTVKHLDRCLTCLACMTTCPSGVHYMHLVDHARQHIERTYVRPLPERLLRWMLAFVLPHTGRFRLALGLARLARPLRGLLSPRLRALIDAAREVWGRDTSGEAWDARGADRAATGAVVADAPGAGTRRAATDVAGSQAGSSSAVGVKPAAPAADAQPRIRRVALLPGCVQPALRPQINAATERLLRRFGVEVVVAEDTGCCGALVHHLGRERDSTAQAKADIEAWTRELEARGLDAIVITASGCGTMVKDYGFLFRNDPQYAAKAARISGLARDVSEVLAEVLPRDAGVPGAGGTGGGQSVGAPSAAGVSAGGAVAGGSVAVDAKVSGTSAEGQSRALRVAYHSACSLQHGQKLHGLAPQLLRSAGFTVLDVPEGHICCGSAGTYSMLQPEMSGQLRDRKARNIESVQPDVVATGNIGCITHIAQATGIPIVHTVELLDWATGGPIPAGLKARVQ